MTVRAKSRRSLQQTTAAPRAHVASFQTHKPLWLVLAVALIVFIPVLRHDFTNWDDPANILENPIVMSPTWPGIARVWTQPLNNMYSPLVFTSFMFDRLIGGGSAVAFHATNLVLHLASIAIVYFLLRLILPNTTSWGAAAGALLFAIHPLQAEPVSWATGRKDLLAGLLGLVAIYLHLRSNTSGTHLRRFQVAAFTAFALSLFAKATATTLPLVVFALEVFFLRIPTRKSVLRLLPWIAVAALFALVAVASQPLPEWLKNEVPLIRRPLLAGHAIAFYFAKLLWPSPLSPVYTTNATDATAHSLSILYLLPVLIITAAAIWKRHGKTAALLIVFLAPLLPVLGLVPFLYQHISLTADRYMYLSMLAPAIAVTWLLSAAQSHPDTRKLLTLTTITIALVLCVVTNRQSRYWRDSETLWTHAVKVTPGVPEAHTNLAFALHHKGDTLGAEKQLELAVKADRNFNVAWNLLALLQLERAGPEVALPAMKENIRALEEKGYSGQRLAEAYSNLSELYLRKRDYAAAETAAIKSLKIVPTNAAAKVNLAEAVQKKRR